MLRVENVDAGYGRLQVLEDVSLEARAGEMVTLVGSNGAGKSTLLKVVSGLLPVARGRVLLEGEDVTPLAAHRRVRRGLVLVPEGRLLFMGLSVSENLAVGAYSRRGRDARRDLTQDLERVYGLFPVLESRSRQAAGTLSGGEQQMLAVGRALMSRPKMLLLDEPSLGLAPKVIAEIFSSLDALRREGMTILLVEQDATMALKHADRGYVMRTGSIALSGTAEQLISNDDVRHIYLGAWHAKE